MMRRRVTRWASISMTALALTACRSADTPVDPLPTQKPVAAESISVQSWRRTPVFLAISNASRRAHAASTFLSVVQNTLTAANPQTGVNVWSTTFAAPMRDVRAAGSMLRVTLAAVNATETIESFVDAETGTPLWSQPGALQGGPNVLTASADMILSNVGDTLFVGRDRATGAVRWTTRVPFGKCSLSFDDCWIDAGRANGAFNVVRTEVLGATQRLIKISDAGVATVTTFTDPLARGFTVLRNVAVDSTGSLLLFTTFSGAAAIDASTGAVRWSFRTPLLLDADLLEPVVNFVRGSNPVIHLVYPYEATTSGAYASEFVLDATTGTTIRNRTLPGSPRSIALIALCGTDGIVAVRSTGRFTFTNTRTGAIAEGTVREPGTNAVATIPDFPTEAGNFTTGHLVLSNSNFSLIGFRCRP
jgi:outer membrane protein assembly factor BamB